MKTRAITRLALATLVILYLNGLRLLGVTPAIAEEAAGRTQTSKEHIKARLNPAPPRREELILFSMGPIGVGNQMIGSLALYHDPKTERDIDYAEIYDLEWNLIAVHWIDRFGVNRTAIDEGLLEKQDPQVRGRLVMIPEGKAL